MYQRLRLFREKVYLPKTAYLEHSVASDSTATAFVRAAAFLSSVASLWLYEPAFGSVSPVELGRDR